MTSFPSFRALLLIAVLGTHSLDAAAEPAARTAEANRPPNIVFFLIDDLGWTDLGCYGSDFYETPNVDPLCRQEMRFSDAYAASCVCSPTRVVRSENYKLLKFLEDGHVELYHLRDDLGERHDLAGVQMPRPNPAYLGESP